MKLRRGKPGEFGKYYTMDGRFCIWQEPYDCKRWYINAIIDGKTMDAFPPDGFELFRFAKNYLSRIVMNKEE